MVKIYGFKVSVREAFTSSSPAIVNLNDVARVGRWVAGGGVDCTSLNLPHPTHLNVCDIILGYVAIGTSKEVRVGGTEMHR